MNRSEPSTFNRLLCLSVVMVASYAQAAFAQRCDPPAARVSSVQGTVEAQVVGQTTWQAMQLNDTYCPGDTIRVGENSRADMSLANGSVMRLRADSTLTLEEVRENRTSLISLLKGAAHFFSRRPNSLEVRTPYTVAGVRGTEFYIHVADNQTDLTIFTGQVVARNEAGSLALTGGHSAVVEKGKAPVLRVVAQPRDAVQWALYYPPVIYGPPDKLKAGTDWERQVGTSMESYLQGDVQKAFEAIANVPDSVREPDFFTYRASLHLAVGQVDEARADIERALQLNANDSDVLALQTIIAVVQNDKEQAFDVARRAVEADANSATAQIALSYAQQARFDLEGARASLNKAVQLEPDNALAWARLAELHASFGNLDKSLKAAKQAASLEPNLARTQTVLGFAYLTQVETEKARAAFDKAIALDQADPLPRLGMGLAIIRDGDVTAGSRELEMAASLDPNNSLIRSYLGKAYYEEKRGELDEREFDVAKQLDPNDPTPWFYSAIAKQTTNRPVEALQDMQKAIELNDNRAVYRSKLLLDSDLAARSASQARIYSDLGFQQLALVEGWKSVNADPTNYSAHRFLADSYAALPRHEIARVSELLQSQLLQPLNMTPIQPRLAESNLFLISAGGPGALSFNEFNPLFNRNGVAMQANGFVGENDTYAGEGVLSGIAGIGSYSIGYSHFETDGFRDNNDQEDDIFNAFVQVEISPKTSFQAEFRRRDNERGDLLLRGFEDHFSRGERNKLETNTIRLGGRHSFSPRSTLIGQFLYQDMDEHLRDDQFPRAPISTQEQRIPQNMYAIELQHLFRTRYINLTSGAGYFSSAGEFKFSLTADFPPPPEGPGTIEFADEFGIDLTHTNFYLYSQINLLKNLTFIVGASVDLLEGDQPELDGEDQFNPKFGFIWNPLPSTTIRGAVFRVLARDLINGYTVEPTQIAGFNQFFADFRGTESWRYGVAIDQKFTTRIYGGVELSKRETTVPTVTADTATGMDSIITEDRDEYLARAYFYGVLNPWITAKVEYRFERIESELTGDLKEVDTHRVPLGLRFFHPSGLSSSLTGTYYHQEGDFFRFTEEGHIRGDDAFWLVDATLGYRLPRRYGIVTVGVTNLLDQNFNYYDSDERNPTTPQGRMVFANLTLAWP